MIEQFNVYLLKKNTLEYTMGVYDYFKGTCPKCGFELDTSPEFGRCGEIQTKLFSRPYAREFRPGQKVPHYLGEDVVPIGTTVCCNTKIAAHFEQTSIVERFVCSKSGSNLERTKPATILVKYSTYELVENEFGEYEIKVPVK